MSEGTVILCFYIETKDQVALERLLMENDFPFYDATHLNNLTMDNKCSTLEDVECFLENK